jgi:putative ABC transport system permease protein
MSPLPQGVRGAFRLALRRPHIEQDVDDEVAFHLEMRVAELVARGWTEDAARNEALRRFGDRRHWSTAMTAVDQERVASERRAEWFDDLRQDLRFALRSFGRAPLFSALAVLTLALGIGATTAIFSTLDAVLLRPLPYRNPDRLVHVTEVGDNGRPNSVAGGAFLDWEAHQTQFDSLVLTGPISGNLRIGGVPERVTGLEVSHDFLRVLGVAPLLGSGFLAEHDRPGGANNVVLLTEELWRTRYSSPAPLGRADRRTGRTSWAA